MIFQSTSQDIETAVISSSTPDDDNPLPSANVSSGDVLVMETGMIDRSPSHVQPSNPMHVVSEKQSI